MEENKKTSNDNQTSVRVTGICPSCKKTNTGIATDGDIPKYCRLCGSRMNYSFSSNLSSKKGWKMEKINYILAVLISKLIKLPDREISESDLITFLYLVNLLNLINRKKVMMR